MINSLLTRVFGSRNERQLRQLNRIVAKINALEPEIEKLSDDSFRQDAEFKQRIAAAKRWTRCCRKPSRSAAKPAAACWACATTTCS
jgi:preprotein translocase subunit SecA